MALLEPRQPNRKRTCIRACTGSAGAAQLTIPWRQELTAMPRVLKARMLAFSLPQPGTMNCWVLSRHMTR